MKSRFVSMPLGTSHLITVFQRELVSRHSGFAADGAAMFLAFADAEPTTEGVANFREEYRIADGIDVIDTTAGTTVMMPCVHDQVDVQNWKDEILAMRRCIAIWNMIRSDDTIQLNRVFRWESDPTRGLSVIYDGHAEPGSKKSARPSKLRTRDVIASEADSPLLMRQLRAGDTIGPAKMYLEWLINDRLETGVQPRMFATITQSSINRPTTAKSLSLNLVPKHFIAAVWLQLAEAIDGDKRYERCRLCESWFEVSRGRTHKDRKYCSDLCKVNYHRKKKEAKRLASIGKRFPKIAELLNLDVETVNDWFSPVKKEK